MKLSIIIPAYNEEKRILKTLEDYCRHFKYAEIIVVVDGSDKTAEIVRNFSKKIKVIESCTRIGKGGAVLLGFKHAHGNFIGFTDADCSTGPKEFEKILQILKKSWFDGAIGSRAIKGANLIVKQNSKRMFFGWVFRNYVNILFGLKIKDTQCGAKIFSKNAVKSVLNEIKIKGFAFDVELIYKLKRKGYKIKEIPIKWADDKNSKVKFRNSFDMAWDLMKLKLGFL